MNGSNIYQVDIIKQDARESGMHFKHRMAFDHLIEQLIRENGHYRHGSFYLDVNTLPLYDKRLLISHLRDSEDYEHACKSPTATEVLFDEIKKYAQEQIDYSCAEVYRDVMEEMRSYR